MTDTSIYHNTERAEGMLRELLYIHTLLRRDLARVNKLAEEVRSGHPVQHVVDTVRDLETNSPLWRLRDGCWRYCRFVHGHHTLEDAALFPMARRADPSLHPVIDKLEEDHLVVHHITERIAVLAANVAEQDSFEHRADLTEALNDLEHHLLTHLTFEEASLGPLLSSWDSWPRG
ncbi:MAG: hemerythrin domain-containing protein [Thermomicrobiales bacterium]|nr:hemerythrin domain-containing protein [Thermomicrobiales bacterium]